MKTAFIIESQYEYRHLGPLIDEFLYNNENVFVFIFKNLSFTKNVLKPWQIPDVDNIPQFLNGTPTVIVEENEKFLCKKITDLKPDNIFFHSGVVPDRNLVFEPRSFLIYLRQELKNKTKFYSMAGEFYDSVLWGLEAMEPFDGIFAINEHAKQVQFDILNTRNYHKQNIKESMQKIKISGKPVLDSLLKSSNKSKEKSLVFMTHNFSANKFGRIILSKNRYLNLLKILYKEGDVNLDVIKNFYSKTTYSDIISLIYKTSKDVGMNFIIKSRIKDSQNVEYKELYKLNCDTFYCEEEKSFYPETESSKLISKSKKLIGFKTFAFLEAVISRTKALHLEIPADKTYKKIDKFNIFNRSVRGWEEGTLNNFGSCIQTSRWDDLKKINKFIEMDDPVSERDRGEYLKKYIYPPDLKYSSKYIYKVTLKG